jgi:transcriptional/translational regulatory protein YebC/TACO1
VVTAEVTQLPKAVIPVDAASAGRLLRLVDALEDLEDVQAVFGNYEIPEELMARLADE